MDSLSRRLLQARVVFFTISFSTISISFFRLRERSELVLYSGCWLKSFRPIAVQNRSQMISLPMAMTIQPSLVGMV